MYLLGAVLLLGSVSNAATASAHDKNDVNNSKASVVSRLDPALRKALLQALSNLENESSDEADSQTDETDDDFEAEGTTTTKNDVEILEESTTSADQVSSVQYHSYVLDPSTNNSTKNETNNYENEIIHTIIVKAAKKSATSTQEKSNDNDEVENNSDVIVKFDHLDPVKDSDIQVESVQVARSVATLVKSNDVEQNVEKTDQNTGVTKLTLKDVKKPVTPSTTTTTTTTTPAPTHNDDGENIEQVDEDDVKIFQAPLVTAFTIQQDANGRPNTVIPIYKSKEIESRVVNRPDIQALPTKPLPADFDFEQSEGSQPAVPTAVQPLSQSQSENINPQFSQLTLEQKQQQLEQQVFYLQDQQRKQEILFREQQEFESRQALLRQQQLLQEQRLRIEEEYRTKQQQYLDQQQQQQIYQQQQQQYQHQLQQHQQQLQQQEQLQQQQQQHQVFLQQLPVLQQQHQFQQTHQQAHQPTQQQAQQIQQQSQQQIQQQSQQQIQQHSRFNIGTSSVQIIPSVSFAPSFQIPTQQLLPSKESGNFRNTNQVPPFQAQQQFNSARPADVQFQLPNPPQLSINQELPQRLFQQFQSNNVQRKPTIDPILATPDTQNRNRVFRQEPETANFGFNAQNSQNRISINQNQANPADNFLQNLLQRSGISGKQNEDLNIITKVLALNHGITVPSSNFILNDSRRN